MKNIIDKILDRLKGGVIIKSYEDQINMEKCLKADPETLTRWVLERHIKEELYDEIEELEKRERDIIKRENEIKNTLEIKEKELEHKGKMAEMEVDNLKKTLEASIRAETDEDKKEIMKTGLENIQLKEKITFLEEALKEAKISADRANNSLADTLKTAFSNQPNVVINTK